MYSSIVLFISLVNLYCTSSFDSQITVHGNDVVDNQPFTYVLQKNTFSCVSIFTIAQSENDFSLDCLIDVVHSIVNINNSVTTKQLVLKPGKEEENINKIQNISYGNEDIVLLLKDIDMVEFYFKNIQIMFKHPKAKILLIAYDECLTDMSEVTVKIEDIYRGFWIEKGILNMIVFVLCSPTKFVSFGMNLRAILTYSPFHKSGNKTWGKVVVNDYSNYTSFHEETLKNFNRFPLNVTFFPSSLAALDPITNTYWGVDYDFMTTIAASLNYEPQLTMPLKTSDLYGAKLLDGTFTGSVGDLLSGRTQLSFVGLFLKEYGTSDIEFSSAMYYDRICILVHKAELIPGWMLLYRCFTTNLWLLTITSTVVVSLLFSVMNKLNNDVTKRFRKFKKVEFVWYKKAWDVIAVLYSAPCRNLPKRLSERVFVASCLLWSLTVITGGFQGSLSTIYTTPSHFDDIDTLEDLDNSGLTILSAVQSFSDDVFGRDSQPDTILGRLRRKTLIIHSSIELWRNLTQSNDFGVLRRLSSMISYPRNYTSSKEFNIVIRELHIVKECPKSYYSGYPFRRRSILLETFDAHVQRLVQHGFLRKWHSNMLLRSAFERKRMVTYVYNAKSKTILTLYHLQLPFYLLFVGLFVSFVVLLYEIHYDKKLMR